MIDLSDKELIFPVEFDIKIIMNAFSDIEYNKKVLVKIFNELDIVNSNWRHKLSAQNNYISFSVFIVVENRETMNLLYGALKKEPSIRFAV